MPPPISASSTSASIPLRSRRTSAGSRGWARSFSRGPSRFRTAGGSLSSAPPTTHGSSWSSARRSPAAAAKELVRLPLARGHPGGGAAGPRDVPDALAGDGHGARVPAPPAVEEPAARIAPAVVRRADGDAHDTLERAAHARDLDIRQRAGEPARVEASLVQDLVGDPVAHPGREALVEQQ